MNWYQVVLQVAGILSLLVLLGGAWALVRGSFNKARVQELRDDNDDLRKRNSDLEHKIDAHKIKEEAMETKIGHQNTEIELLTQMVTQRADVGDVKVAVIGVLEDLKEHHEEAKQYWIGINTALTVLLRDREREAGHEGH